MECWMVLSDVGLRWLVLVHSVGWWWLLNFRMLGFWEQGSQKHCLVWVVCVGWCGSLVLGAATTRRLMKRLRVLENTSRRGQAFWSIRKH